MTNINTPSEDSIRTSGELAAMGATIRAILREQFGGDRKKLEVLRDAAKASLDKAAASLAGHPGTDVFVEAAKDTLDELFGV